MLYFVVSLFALAALAFAAWPLIRRGRDRESLGYDEAIKQLYRQRAAELEVEAPDAALREELTSDMGAVLLTEAQADQETLPAAVQPGRPVLLLAVAAMVPILAVVLYFTVADPGVTRISGAEAVMTLNAQEDRAALESWRDRLSARVEAEPADSKSWYLLGHGLLKLGSYAESAEAFATTSALVGDDMNVKIYWLQARYLAARGVMDDVSRGLANELLAANPNLSPVLELLALDAFQAGDGPTAISYLNRAITGTEDTLQQASFAQAIRQVRSALTDPPPGVDVAISAETGVPQTASVFVIARPVGGGMPYAVVKRPAVLLPFEVRLDDLVSMSPDRGLSQAERYEVLVRLSMSGSAMAQDGDWQWQSAPLTRDTASRLDATLTPP